MTCWYARVALLGQIALRDRLAHRFSVSPIPLIAFRIRVPSGCSALCLVHSYALVQCLGSRLSTLGSPPAFSPYPRTVVQSYAL
jgi:hypothetical protein